ncbi:hypothetical protein LguiB_003974 [Lonicera macranthoides]
MYKSKLQELCQQHSWSSPEYTAVKEGPDHNPKFTATVSVNSVQFHTPSDHQCQSSKDAQNQAAKIAFDHFSAPKSILQHHSSSSSSNSSSPAAPPNPNPNATPFSTATIHDCANHHLIMNEFNLLTEISQLYKSRLQIYAQKKNLALPTYSNVADGPPHARRFKSTVTVDDKTYEAAEFYSTVKEAEQAAAKVALESLSSVDTRQEASPPNELHLFDETLYRSLLQELTQKEGLRVPTYETIKSGPPHTPTFLSNVVIKGETFHGQVARTKKQAEMSAAKAAYKALIERSTRKNLALKSQMTAVSQPNAMREMEADLGCIHIVIHEGKAEEEKGRARQNPNVISPGSHISGPQEVSQSLQLAINFH